MDKKGQAKRRKRGAARLALRAALWAGRWTVRLVLAAVLVLAALFAYLHHVGVPAVFTEVFLDRLAREGYFLQVERFRLEIDRGLVAEKVRMFAQDDAAVPFLEAEELTVAAEPAALWKRKRFSPVLAVVGGTLRANPGDGSVGDGVRAGNGEVQIRDIQLRFTATLNEMLLREFSAECLGIRFRGRGAVYFAPERREEAVQTRRTNPLSQALEALDALPDGVRRAVEELNAVEFGEPPEADFSFVVYLAHPESNRASLRLRNPKGGTTEGGSFDGCDLELEWKEGVLYFPTVQFRKGGGVAGASGWFDTKEGMVRASVVETIPPSELLALCPEQVQAVVEENVGDARFPVSLKWETGPIAVDKALEEFKAKLWLAKATVRGIDVEEVELEVERKDGVWLLPEGKVQLGGDGEWATRVAVSNGYFREADKRFEIQWAGAVNPHHAKAALPTNYQEIVDWFWIGEPVSIEGAVTGGTLGDPAVYCYGSGVATNFAVRGEPVQSFKTRVDITNEVMHLTGMVLQRPEGWARGDVHMAFSNQTLRLDVESAIDARAATRMIAPAVSNFFVPFRLEGPARVRVAGVLDYCNFALNRMEGHVAAEDFGYGRWKADSAEWDFSVRGRRVAASNVVAEAYGGHAEGSMRLYSLGRDDQWRYEVQLDSVKAVQIDRLLEASIGHPVEKLKGDLYLNGQVAGIIGEGQGRTVTGSGRAEIRNGFLMESKLFAGLTAWLNKLLPDFSAFAQTEAGGDFSIRNSRIHSKDIRLEGTVYSVKAAGSFGFDNSLDYVAEVQLLRGGMVASLVRLATMPVTRLLEFRLGGLLSEPTWKAENLTLDVFKKLVGGENGGEESGDGEEGTEKTREGGDEGMAHPG